VVFELRIYDEDFFFFFLVVFFLGTAFLEGVFGALAQLKVFYFLRALISSL